MSKRNPIEITFYFNTIEEAIATLGSLVQKAAPVANIDKPAQPLVIETPVTKPRKPRADAGVKRGSYKNVEAAAPSTQTVGTAQVASGSTPQSGEVAATASTPETAPPEASAQQEVTAAQPLTPDAGAAPVADESAVQAALERLFAAKGAQPALALLAEFGVKRGRDLKPEQRADFIKKADEAANG